MTSSVTSCDAGKQHNQPTIGPAILVLGVNVGDDRKLPNDGAIQIAFDRYLLPSTVNRQSVLLLDGSGRPLTEAGESPIITYDPIARTVTLRPPKVPWLTEGVPYKLVLGIPEGDSDTGGIRAIDRAKLFAGQKLEFSFFVGPVANQPIEPTSTLCRDVLPIFYAKCSSPTCHGTGGQAAASLVLDTAAGISATALGNRVAQGANTGGLSGTGKDPGRQFGTDMPLIDPGNPGNSWLLYKIELAKPPVIDAGVPSVACSAGLAEPQVTFAFNPLVPQAQRSADDIERGILNDFVLGREMPFPLPQVGGYGDQPLTFEERQKVRIWIQSLVKGAPLPECGGCGDPTVGTDAGTREGGTVEAGADAGQDAGIADAADQ